MRARACRSRAKQRRGLVPSTGYSGNTRQAALTWRKSNLDPAERNMREICDTLTNRGDRVGGRPIKSVTPLGADKLYDRFVKGPKGKRLRTAEKLIVLCGKAWRVVHRLHPGEFPKDIPNPWMGVTMATRIKLTKHAVTREQVYTFAIGCVERGEPECG